MGGKVFAFGMGEPDPRCVEVGLQAPLSHGEVAVIVIRRDDVRKVRSQLGSDLAGAAADVVDNDVRGRVCCMILVHDFVKRLAVVWAC